MIVIFDKSSIKINEFEKDFDVVNKFWLRLWYDKVNFEKIHIDSFFIDNVIEKIDFFCVENIFKWLEVNFDCLKSLEN